MHFMQLFIFFSRLQVGSFAE